MTPTCNACGAQFEDLEERLDENRVTSLPRLSGADALKEHTAAFHPSAPEAQPAASQPARTSRRMTKADLVAKAAEFGIENATAMNKKDLTAAIAAAEVGGE